MPFFIFLLLFLVPVLEIASIIYVVQWIGALNTFLLWAVLAAIGMALIRSQSYTLPRRVLEAARAGTPPEQPLLSGAAVSLAGFLLIVPGFLTDILALVLLIPPARRLLWRVLLANANARFESWRWSEQREARRADHGRKETVIDVEFTRVPPETEDKGTKGGGSSPWTKPPE